CLLHFVLIGQRLQFTGGHKEVASLLSHALVAEILPEHLHVFGAVDARVFFDLLKVGEDAPLPHFMCDKRDAEGRYTLPEIGDTFRSFVPGEASYAAAYLKLGIRDNGPAAADRHTGIYPARVLFLPEVHEIVQILYLVTRRL